MAIDSKEDLEFLVKRYLEVLEAAAPGLRPQGHTVEHGRPLDTQRALELSACFMHVALAIYDTDQDEALEYYWMGRGLALAEGVFPEEEMLPEPTVPYTNIKPV